MRFSPLLGASTTATESTAHDTQHTAQFQSPSRGFNDCNCSRALAQTTCGAVRFSPLLGASTTATNFIDGSGEQGVSFSPLLGASTTATSDATVLHRCSCGFQSPSRGFNDCNRNCRAGLRGWGTLPGRWNRVLWSLYCIVPLRGHPWPPRPRPIASQLATRPSRAGELRSPAARAAVPATGSRQKRLASTPTPAPGRARPRPARPARPALAPAASCDGPPFCPVSHAPPATSPLRNEGQGSGCGWWCLNLPRTAGHLSTRRAVH